MPVELTRQVDQRTNGSSAGQTINDTQNSTEQRGARSTTRTLPTRTTTIQVPAKTTTTIEPATTRTVTDGARTTETTRSAATETTRTVGTSGTGQTVNEFVGATISFKIRIRGGLQGAGGAPPITGGTEDLVLA